MWGRAALIAAVCVTGATIIGWASLGGLWRLLAEAPYLWLLVAGIPMAFLCALLMPDRPAPVRVAAPRIPVYVARELPSAPPPALPAPQVTVIHNYYYAAPLAAPARAPLPMMVRGEIERAPEQ